MNSFSREDLKSRAVYRVLDLKDKTNEQAIQEIDKEGENNGADKDI